MKIKYIKSIEGSSVVSFLAQAWCNLMKNKQWDRNSVLLTEDLQCVYALDGRKIIGAITFWLGAPDECLNINLAFVHPAHRRKGVMKQMWMSAVDQAKLQGATWASNVCYPGNEEIASFCKSVGGYVYTHQYRIDLNKT